MDSGATAVAQPPPSDQPSSPRTRATLVVERVGRRSAVVSARAASPLRLLTPRNHGHAAWVYASSYGGGLVDGDALDLAIEVGPGAALLTSTQSSTKLYAGTTHLFTTARVEAGGIWVNLPDPIVPFADAVHRSVVSATLAPGASALLVETLHAGRVARGERWAFRSFDASTKVRGPAIATIDERVVLEASSHPIAGRMAGMSAFSTVTLAGPLLAPFAAQWAEALAKDPLGADASLIEAASPRPPGAWVFRIAGRDAEPVSSRVRARLSFVAALLGDDPFARKW